MTGDGDIHSVRAVKDITLESPSETEFFLVHGYTGSTTDFNELPHYLHDTCGVTVRVVLLQGHGTSVQHLDKLGYHDFLEQIEGELQSDLAKGRQVFVGGVSFGALLALVLATRYPVAGVFNICVPYILKFPFSVPGVELLRFFKKYWRKSSSAHEQELRRNAFRYPEMHINGLRVVKQACRDLARGIPNITCPVLTIHSIHDPIGSHKSVNFLEKNIRAAHDCLVLDNDNHNIFFSDKRFEVYRKIESFFALSSTRAVEQRDRVAAIVPAYNEAQRIGAVLTVLTQTSIIDEVIVVDDGSTDGTAAVARRFPGVQVLRNTKNSGKAYSIQRGIDTATADTLFLCDADLRGLTPTMVEAIIRPVLSGRYSMFIGVRSNVMQKTVTLFALNSGERAFRRELWRKLPRTFKYRYRLEAGLNFIARTEGMGYGWKKFGYYQTLKEKKYGLVQGTFLRWWMNFDVLYAYLLVMSSPRMWRYLFHD